MSKLDELEKLGELKSSGAITEQEFEKLKTKLLHDTVLPQEGDVYPERERTNNGKATAGMVLGIVSLIVWIIPLIGAPVSIIGLIQASKGQRSEKKNEATVGLVLNILGLVATIINASIGAYRGANGLL